MNCTTGARSRHYPLGLPQRDVPAEGTYPMGMWQRFTMIFKSKANKALDRAEDPRETLDYSYEKQLELLQKVRRGVADVATSRKRLELQIGQLDQQSSKLETQAKAALGGGREDLAREALTRRSNVSLPDTGHRFDPFFTDIQDAGQFSVRKNFFRHAHTSAHNANRYFFHALSLTAFPRIIAAPAQHHRAPGQSGAKPCQHHRIARLDPPGCQRFVQRNRNRS